MQDLVGLQFPNYWDAQRRVCIKTLLVKKEVLVKYLEQQITFIEIYCCYGWCVETASVV
jgi:hypothetical protein